MGKSRRSAAKTRSSTATRPTTLDSGLPELEAWEEPCRPLASLAFVAPILLAYEAGILFVGHDQARNAADAWLRSLLDWLGFGQYFLLPALTCSILLAWHHTTRQPWSVSTGVFSRMFVETSVFALVLLLIAQAQSQLFAATQRAFDGATLASTAHPRTAAGIVGYLGAGLYEELLFRLMLLPALAAGDIERPVCGGPLPA
jgi:membrane protease YdiL (CAAX protease family)